MNKTIKGIVLAGGLGTRLSPLTISCSKQLLPVFNKPMIYYPITTLLLAGIRDILIISTEKSLGAFKDLLGDGSQWGCTLTYQTQDRANGIAEALILGAKFIGKSDVALILGDNLFHGVGLGESLHSVFSRGENTIFSYEVSNPSQYGVVESDSMGKVLSLQEKPPKPKSKRAVTGLYFMDYRSVEWAKKLNPSSRGELEIIDVLEQYRVRGELQVLELSGGTTWMDMGTFEDLADASEYIRVLERRQGNPIGDPNVFSSKR